MKNKTKPFLLASVFIALFIAYIITDYIDIPSKIGLATNHMNLEFLGEIINATVVIILYIISFYAIEKRQRDKADEAAKREELRYKNSKQTAEILIKSTYKECLETLSLVNNEKALEEYIVPKVDFNKTILENEFESNLINLPFKNLEQILHYAENGYITSKELEFYLYIQAEFRSVVMMKITFFDLYRIDKSWLQSNLQGVIENRYNSLYNSIETKLKENNKY